MEVHLSREADAGLGLAIEGVQGILSSILAIEGGSQEQQSVKASAELPMRAILSVRLAILGGIL